MKRLYVLLSSIFLLGALGACAGEAVGNKPSIPQNVRFDQPAFDAYWKAGKAELTSYKLTQARYGEAHPGNALMVFVMEEFLKDKQVKLESQRRPEALPILKLNFLKKFTTGIYDYSMMSSVFTPLEFRKFPRTLKVTTTSQEWCGHTFTQFNLRGPNYRVRQFSYFEDESDKDLKLPVALLEDELWSKIRISPDLLPVGDLQMVPGTMYIRLLHKQLSAQAVKAIRRAYRGKDFKGKELQEYRLEYPALKRTLSIVYENSFPYTIQGWSEHYVSGWGKSAKPITTIGRRTKSIMSDYWDKHDLKDMALRKKLGL